LSEITQAQEAKYLIFANNNNNNNNRAWVQKQDWGNQWAGAGKGAGTGMMKSIEVRYTCIDILTGMR
jgi:hypothetical protein